MNYELLFWKVIKNKYLFNKIINYIQSIEWVIYDDVKQLHIDNRMKLKDIHSLGFMIKNKLYTLIKFKLENNEYIEIDFESISILFKELSISKIKKNKIKNEEIKEIKEIIIQLLEKRRNEFEIIDLTCEAVKCDSVEVLRLLAYEPFSIIVYPSTLEHAVQKLSVTMFKCISEILINNHNSKFTSRKRKQTSSSNRTITNTSTTISNNDDDGDDDDDVKSILLERDSFGIVFKYQPFLTNSIAKNAIKSVASILKLSIEEDIGIITSTIGTTTTTSNDDNEIQEQQPTKKFKEEQQPKSYDYTNRLIKLIKSMIDTFKELSKSEIIDHSFKELTMIYQLLNQGDQSTVIPSSIKQLQTLSIIKLYQIYKNNSNNQQCKELYQEYYKGYICKYNETINECHIGSDQINKINSKSSYQQFLRVAQLFEVINENENEIVFGKINKINDIINDVNSGTLVWNQLLFNLVVHNNFEKEGPIVIFQKSTVDWILNCNNKSILSFIYDNFNRITYGTLELANYVNNDVGGCNLLNHLLKNSINNNNSSSSINDLKKHIYHHIWNKSIKLSNHKLIKFLESLDIGFKHTPQPPQTQQQQQQQQQAELDTAPPIPTIQPSLLSTDQPMELINYFNETGFYEFKFGNLKNSISQIIKLYGNSNQDDEFSKIKLNFRFFNYYNIKSTTTSSSTNSSITPEIGFQNEHDANILGLLILSIMEKDFKMIQIILNSNIFEQMEHHRKIEFSEEMGHLPKFLYNRKGDIYQLVKPNNSGIDHDERLVYDKIKIIEIIKKILKKIKLPNTTSGNQQQPIIEIYEPISVLVNFFFEKLLQIKGITMDEIKSVYKLIQDSFITVKHDLYHIFWYLHIKDIKLSYYIIRNEGVNSVVFESRMEDAYYDCSQYNDQFFNLEDCIRLSEFTFDSINQLSFDQLLEMLITQLSPLADVYINFDADETDDPIVEQTKQKYHSQVENELEYYLIIRRIDLFFNKLKKLKEILDVQNSTHYNFNSQTTGLFELSSILFNSPCSTLKYDSTLFKDSNDDDADNENGLILETPNIPQIFHENLKKFEFQPIEPLAYTFIFSSHILKLMCKLFNLNEIIQILKFNYYQTSFQYSLLDVSLECRRFDISRLILDNFNIHYSILSYQSRISEFIIENYFHLVQFPCRLLLSSSSSVVPITQNEFKMKKLLKYKFLHLLYRHLKSSKQVIQLQQFVSTTSTNEIKMNILNDSLNIISNSNYFKNLNAHDVIFNPFSTSSNNPLLILLRDQLFKQDEYQQLFKNLFNQKYQEQQQQLQDNNNSNNFDIYYNLIEDNIFLNSFCNGNIRLCELILSKYSYYNFKITSDSISKTIKNNNIHIIIYFLKYHLNLWKRFINNSNISDDSLYNHFLKCQLSDHKDYKYLSLNFLK